MFGKLDDLSWIKKPPHPAFVDTGENPEALLSMLEWKISLIAGSIAMADMESTRFASWLEREKKTLRGMFLCACEIVSGERESLPVYVVAGDGELERVWQGVERERMWMVRISPIDFQSMTLACSQPESMWRALLSSELLIGGIGKEDAAAISSLTDIVQEFLHEDKGVAGHLSALAEEDIRWMPGKRKRLSLLKNGELERLAMCAMEKRRVSREIRGRVAGMVIRRIKGPAPGNRHKIMA